MIVWGKKRVEKTMGYAAGFCPICRDIAPFKITRVGMASHIYFIPLGEGQLVDHVATCTQCGSAKSVDPTRYETIEKAAGTHLEALVCKTYPSIREVCAERLAVEAKIKSHSAACEPSKRQELLMEPFKYLAGEVESLYRGGTQLDKASGIGCLVTIFVPTALFFASALVPINGRTQDKVLIAAGVVFTVALVYTLVQLARVPGRTLTRKVIPNLVRALAPLKPTTQELAACLDKLKTAGYKIGSKVSADKLWQAIQRPGMHMR